MKTFALTLLTAACFAVLPKVYALSPPPDGGYPGGNTAEGQNALLSLSTGKYNTAVGLLALESNTEGNFNTANGAGTLLFNTADENTATGAGALLANTTGGPNTATGAFALFSNTTGNNNNAFGFEALFNNTTGPFNNAFGNGALASNTTGDRNTAIGEGALLANTTGSHNIGIGVSALRNNSTGHDNIAIGQDASSQSQGGQFNTAVGSNALVFNSADGNTAIGGFALPANTAGASNTGLGEAALFNNTTGNNNTAVGASALGSCTTGNNNIAIGFNAGSSLTTFSNNIDIGNTGVAADTDTIRIGDTQNGNTITFIAGIIDAGVTGATVLVTENGQLGVAVSSKRFKSEIEPMDKASEALFSLKPVRFRYNKKIDPHGAQQFGLVAEDVENVSPNLVVHDQGGKPYSVRYEAVNAMLLNEFLKEHKIVEHQERTIEELRSAVAQQRKNFDVSATKQHDEIRALTIGLQKVSAQLTAANASHNARDVSGIVKGSVRHATADARVALYNP